MKKILEKLSEIMHFEKNIPIESKVLLSKNLFYDKATEIKKDNFNLIEENNNKKTLFYFIDGGNNNILSLNNFSIDLLSFSIAIFLDKKVKSIQSFEILLLSYLTKVEKENTITFLYENRFKKKEQKNTIFQFLETDFFDIIPKEITTDEDDYFKTSVDFFRRIIELNLLKEIIKKEHTIKKFLFTNKKNKNNINKSNINQDINLENINNSESIFILDGSFNSKYNLEKEIILSIKKELENKKVKNNNNKQTISAVSKNSSLITKELLPIKYYLESFNIKKPYFIKIIENQTYDSFFYKYKNIPFRCDIIDSKNNNLNMFFSKLVKMCNDGVFLGYPYGLIVVDDFARVSNDKKRYLTQVLNVLISNKNLKKLKKIENSHSVLDKIKF